MTHDLHITRQKYRMPDDDEWLRFVPGKDVAGRAEAIAARYTDTPQAAAFLTRSVLTLNKEGMRRKAGEAFAWVPDREVGEMVIFGFPGLETFRTAREATPEAYIAQDPSKFADRGFRVLEHTTNTYETEAGPTASVSTVQRERMTTSVTLVGETVTFPQAEGLLQAVSIMLFTTHFDMAGQAGTFSRLITNSLGVKIERPDGTTFTVGLWDE